MLHNLSNLTKYILNTTNNNQYNTRTHTNTNNKPLFTEDYGVFLTPIDSSYVYNVLEKESLEKYYY